MPYASKKELPAAVKSLPSHAQTIFRSAFNAAFEKYGEERAFAIAWAAVKNRYKKEGDKWVAKKDSAVHDASEPMVLIERMDFDDKSETRITSDGFLVGRPRVARTGIQIYKGWELGVPNLDEVRVYRPEDEVFSNATLRSFAHKTITLDHPSEMVNADNWKEFSVGHSGDEVARDGDYIRVPMVVMDSKAIAAFKSGKKQLSAGYGAQLVWETGTTPAGEAYDAKQISIRDNHIAIVDDARGGPMLCLGDSFSPLLKGAAWSDEDIDSGGSRDKARIDAAWKTPPNERRPKMGDRTIVVDGVTIDVPEISAQVVQRAIAKLEDEMKRLRETTDQQIVQAANNVAEMRRQVETKDGEIASLKRQLAENEMTPARLDAMVRGRVDIIEKTRAILGDGFTCEGKTDIEIKRAVVAARLGEQLARNLTDEGINGAFISQAQLAANSGGNDSANLRRAMGQPNQPHSAMDAARIAYDERSKRMQNAYRKDQQRQQSA